MKFGLRARLFLVPLTLLAVIAMATAWAATTSAHRATKRIDDQIQSIGRTLNEPPTFPLTESVLRQMKGLTGADFDFRPGTGPGLSTFGLSSMTDRYSRLERSLVEINGQEFRWHRFPITIPPNENSTLIIYYPESLRREAIWDAVLPPLVLGAGGGLFAAGLTAWLASGLLRRIRRIQAQTKAVAEGDFRTVPIAGPNDELTELAGSVNDMAGKLGSYSERLQQAERESILGQFSGGLAHQLRNAAGGAKLALDLYQLGGDREPLEVAARQIDRISDMVGQFLARERSGVGPHVPFDLREIIQEAIRLYRPQCQHLGIGLTALIPDEPVMIFGKPTEFSHVMMNLLSNAVDAAGPKGNVQVGVKFSGEAKIIIDVCDSGSGPPAALADRLFEPFVTGKTQGIGLGLSVVKTIVEQYGGSINWYREADLTVFRIAFPDIIECDKLRARK
jgi:signal transduction histidine kinase